MSLNLKELFQNKKISNECFTGAFLLSIIAILFFIPFIMGVYFAFDNINIFIFILFTFILLFVIYKIILSMSLIKKNLVFFVKENEYKKISMNDKCLLMENEDDKIYILKINKNDVFYVAIREGEIYHNNGFDYKIITNPFGIKELAAMKDGNIVSSVDLNKEKTDIPNNYLPYNNINF